MPITVAAIAGSAPSILNVVQKLYDLVAAYRDNDKEIKQFASRVKTIESCISAIPKLPSSQDEWEETKEGSIANLEHRLKEADKTIGEFIKKWKSTKFLMSPNIQTAFRKINVQLAESVIDLLLFCQAEQLKIGIDILETVDSLKREITSFKLDNQIDVGGHVKDAKVEVGSAGNVPAEKAEAAFEHVQTLAKEGMRNRVSIRKDGEIEQLRAGVGNIDFAASPNFFASRSSRQGDASQETIPLIPASPSQEQDQRSGRCPEWMKCSML